MSWEELFDSAVDKVLQDLDGVIKPIEFFVETRRKIRKRRRK